MEEDCRQKEEERVNLELELTEVKESLKKALNGGVTLGLTIEPKAGSPGLQVRAPWPPYCPVVHLWCLHTSNVANTVSLVTSDAATDPRVLSFLQLRHQ